MVLAIASSAGHDDGLGHRAMTMTTMMMMIVLAIASSAGHDDGLGHRAMTMTTMMMMMVLATE